VVQRRLGGRLELAGEAAGAEAGDRGHLFQARAGAEVCLDVLDDGAELRTEERAVPPAPGPAGRQDMPEQVGGQMTGAWSVRYRALRSYDTDAFPERRPGGAGIPRQNLDK
jgi:hypothetical protein